MTRVAINGLGRIGKLVLRAMIERNVDRQAGFEIVLLNDLTGDPAMHAHLLEFDSVHGRWRAEFGHDADSVTVDGRSMRLSTAARIEDVPLRELGVDLVVDCTGVFKKIEKIEPYFDMGVKRTLISAPVKTAPALDLVYGVNHHLYDPAKHKIVTAASCTTNCLAPVVKVVHEKIGLRHGVITTIHDVTNTQTIVDRPAKDLRRARSALTSLIPTTTGSATAITVIYPELKGRLNGHAVRAPLLNASLTDCVFEMERPVTVEEVNALFKDAADGELAGILGYEDRPLVSADFVNDPRSSIIDGPSTMVVNGTQLKVFAWYDNEWGYAHRMVDLAQMIVETGV